MINKRITYALSACGGYLNRNSINHSDAIIKKAVWCKLIQDCHSFYQFLTQCFSVSLVQSDVFGCQSCTAWYSIWV